MATPSCPGTITSSDGVAICSEPWVPVEPFALEQLDPEIIASAFAAGFVIVATGFVIGWALRAVLKSINS